jgi:hypothetical protein
MILVSAGNSAGAALLPGKTRRREGRIRRENILFPANPFAQLKRLGVETPVKSKRAKSMETTMRRTLIRYRAKPEAADRNAELIAAVFSELEAAKPDGVRYLSIRLDDDTFIHMVEADSEDGSSPIPRLAAFQAFQSGIRERCAEPPLVREATIVGDYRMLERDEGTPAARKEQAA